MRSRVYQTEDAWAIAPLSSAASHVRHIVARALPPYNFGMGKMAKGFRLVGAVMRGSAAPFGRGVRRRLANHSPVAHFVVVGDSMVPTLASGQHLLASPLPYALSDPVRGDVVLLRDPWGDGRYYVKRIVGLPGEDVRMGDGIVFVGEAELREGYLNMATTPHSGEQVTWSLGDGEYVVLGDNRRDSWDSRAAGAVGRQAIAGRMLFSWQPRTPPGASSR